jgi:hypothetical protein
VNKNQSTKQQLNRIIEYRQSLYARVLGKYRDAQFELIDALLSDRRIHSFAELTLSPLFERGWGSAYQAMEMGSQRRESASELYVRHLPRKGLRVLPIDTTVWPHPGARTLSGMMLEHSPTAAQAKHTAVKGHVYSLLTWVPERGQSWALPVDTQRLLPGQTHVDVAVQQIEDYVRRRQRLELTQGFDVFVGDGRYGNHRFLGPLRDLAGARVVRLRQDRVLYGPPPSYAGRGRPRVHGQRFAFKEPETWPQPQQDLRFDDVRWGTVRVRLWSNLHAKADAKTVFSVLYVEVHLQREKPPRPIWLACQSQSQISAQTIWLCFDQRWSIEPSIRFRKQHLHWTRPAFQQSDRCDRWSHLVDMAYWQLFLAKNLVADQPLPWQKPLPQLTPGRVLKTMDLLIAQIGQPVQPVKRRGKSPGWLKDRKRQPPKRYNVVRRGRDPTLST